MGNRHIHKKVIPTAGGIGMIASFVLICAVYNLWVIYLNKSPEIKLIDPLFFLPMMMLFFVGLYDDRIGMRAIIKLIGQVAAAVLAWYCNIRLKSVFGIQLPEVVSCAATIIWFLMFINAFNLIDGLDGLAAGLAVMAGITMAVVLMIGQHWTTAVTAMCISAICLGFLRYNFHPARIFMGDTGSMFLGYTLAAIGLISSNLNTSFFAVLIPVMACGVPLIDTVLAVWRRSTFKILKNHSWREIFSADRSHLHHRILDAYDGNQSRAAVVIYILAMIISIVGIVSSIIAETMPVLAILITVITMIAVLRKFAVVEISNSAKIIFKVLAMPRRGIFINILQLVMPYYYRASKFSNSKSVPILLYGAGAQLPAYYSCINFYWHKHNERIIGIVDDDTALHGLSVYGYRILGDLSLLENIYECEKFCKIVVITPDPIRKNYEFIKNFCNKNSVELTFFTISETIEPETLRENPQKAEK
jgi:UDP-N-acetylmuramyl pentapeptide phosphotransferase/UDP-N-acetylglucosamine-1-phosphate transferase